MLDVKHTTANGWCLTWNIQQQTDDACMGDSECIPAVPCRHMMVSACHAHTSKWCMHVQVSCLSTNLVVFHTSLRRVSEHTHVHACAGRNHAIRTWSHKGCGHKSKATLQRVHLHPSSCLAQSLNSLKTDIIWIYLLCDFFCVLEYITYHTKLLYPPRKASDRGWMPSFFRGMHDLARQTHICCPNIPIRCVVEVLHA